MPDYRLAAELVGILEMRKRDSIPQPHLVLPAWVAQADRAGLNEIQLWLFHGLNHDPWMQLAGEARLSFLLLLQIVKWENQVNMKIS